LTRLPESFRIGPHEIRPPLVLAPLHEITDASFRRMIRQIGGVGLTVSEMVSSEALIRRARKAEIMLDGDGGRPFSVQLSGASPDRLAEAARMAEASGADMVDLNMGCPAGNVTAGGAGSALMRDFRLAEACVRALVAAVRVPVTVKMRSGWDLPQKMRGDFLEFMRMFEAQGVQAFSLHPRTRSQQYGGEADWSLIARAVEAKCSYPVIGNGDVVRPEDAHRMVRETGCAGVMVGRGAMYNPFIFRQILDPGLEVTTDMRVDATLKFFHLLLETQDEREALHRIKKIGALFTRGIPGGARFRQSLHLKQDVNGLLAEIEALKGPQTQV
jgi:tRNA-dihydrouridine synthase B